MTTTHKSKVHTFETFYGEIPIPRIGHIEAEKAELIHKHFIADKVKRTHRKTLAERIDERNMIKDAMKKVSEGKHVPAKFNQIIKLA